MTIIISQLIVYPIKACQGVSLKSVKFSEEGTFYLDRAWCVVETTGVKEYLSIRQKPALARVKVEIMSNLNTGESVSLRISTPSIDRILVVPVAEDSYANEEDVTVECGGMSTTSDGGWHLGMLRGKHAGFEAAQWFSEFLNSSPERGSKSPGSYVLVRSMTSQVRKVSKFAGPSQVPFSDSMTLQREGKASPFKMQRLNVQDHDGIRFQDMAPLHLASEDSLRALCAAMQLDSYPIAAFRPNIVVKGNAPWSEEDWGSFSVNYISFRGWKRCPRCTVPSRDPTNGSVIVAGDMMRAQKMLRKLFPAKCVDAEWGEEWQGPSFGAHVAVDCPTQGPGATLCVGQVVTPTGAHGETDSDSKRPNEILWISFVFFFLALLLVWANFPALFDADRVEVTSANFAELTEGKTAFIKFFAPWCGHCKAMQPAWAQLTTDYRDHPAVFVGEVDCTAKHNRVLCETHGVRGFPTLLFGDPFDLQPYAGARDCKALQAFASSLPRPCCSPARPDACDAEQLARLLDLMAMPADELDARVRDGEAGLAKAEGDLRIAKVGLDTAIEQAEQTKHAAVRLVWAQGLGLMKVHRTYINLHAHVDSCTYS
jgi:uncharacterized protein YcbX/thiol-disulfide isomerase/thioredoxin